jgi:hypothetical protein
MAAEVDGRASLTCGRSSVRAALAPVDELAPRERNDEVITPERMNGGAVIDGFLGPTRVRQIGAASITGGQRRGRARKAPKRFSLPGGGRRAMGFAGVGAREPERARRCADATAKGRMAPRRGRMNQRQRAGKGTVRTHGPTVQRLRYPMRGRRCKASWGGGETRARRSGRRWGPIFPSDLRRGAAVPAVRTGRRAPDRARSGAGVGIERRASRRGNPRVGGAPPKTTRAVRAGRQRGRRG